MKKGMQDKKIKKWLDDYFKGTKKPFPWKLVKLTTGTEFEKKVWKELWKIPYGKTVSYKDIARKVGSPKAVRAVGQANKKNPFPIIIPCHRVIASDGSLGGYAYGVEMKIKLLRLEGVILSPSPSNILVTSFPGAKWNQDKFCHRGSSG